MEELKEIEVPAKLKRHLNAISPLLFEQVTKYTDRNLAQQRHILITRTYFFSVQKKFFGNYAIHRGFEVGHIQGIVHRRDTDWFVLKLDPQIRGDYRCHAPCWQSVIRILTAIRPELRVWTVDDDVLNYQRQKERLPAIDVNLLIPDRPYS